MFTIPKEDRVFLFWAALIVFGLHALLYWFMTSPATQPLVMQLGEWMNDFVEWQINLTK